MPRKARDYKFINTESFDGKYEEITEKVSGIIKEKGFRVAWFEEIDKNIKVMTTYTSTINPNYYYGFFSHNDDDGYCDCGAPALDWVYSGKTAQLNIFFAPDGSNERWNIRIDSRFHTSKTFDRIVPIIQPLQEPRKSTVNCKSTGKLENEIFYSLKKMLTEN